MHVLKNLKLRNIILIILIAVLIFLPIFCIIVAVFIFTKKTRKTKYYFVNRSLMV